MPTMIEGVYAEQDHVFSCTSRYESPPGIEAGFFFGVHVSTILPGDASTQTAQSLVSAPDQTRCRYVLYFQTESFSQDEAHLPEIGRGELDAHSCA